MRKILKNTAKTKAYLDNLPKIYMVGCWANYGVRVFPFTGKYAATKEGIHVPLVYDYWDCNGACDIYCLRRLDFTTSGQVLLWTQNEKSAYKAAELFNGKEPLRCKDCKHFINKDCKLDRGILYPDPNDYCSLGERK